jgi:16S rRNA (guanine527-N7)-methyltransferase
VVAQASQNFDRAALRRGLEQGAQDLQLDLREAQLELLMDYLGLLVKWNGVYNLTAVREPSQMVTQHLLDSLAAVPAFAGARRVLDVGAGGGLPGVVLAIWAMQAQPEMQITMVDTVHKKTAFLTQVKAELGLANVKVVTARVEQLPATQKFDVITSRAFAELADFVSWSGHLLAEGGRFIALKGVAPDEELARLPGGWKLGALQRLVVPGMVVVPGMEAQRHLVFIEKSRA